MGPFADFRMARQIYVDLRDGKDETDGSNVVAADSMERYREQPDCKSGPTPLPQLNPCDRIDVSPILVLDVQPSRLFPGNGDMEVQPHHGQDHAAQDSAVDADTAVLP